MEHAFRAVIFDIGGVVFDSPLHAIARFEAANGIPDGFVNGVVAATGTGGAWGQLERGKLGMADFIRAFDRECAEAGQPLSAAAMMQAIGEASQPRPRMIEAIGRIRENGLRVAALTNNWKTPDDEPPPQTGNGELRDHFDVFVESSVVGLHKPDPRIYEHACAELRIEASQAVFLDDIGRNLKAARQLGMHTIKVDEPEQALRELSGALGFPVVGA